MQPMVDVSMNRRYRPELHHRRSIRLKGYDYAQSGAYFVTIVTQGRIPHFGEILDGEMLLNDTGLSVALAWEWLATRYPHVKLDEYVVMPNHLHGIIVMADTGRGGSQTAPTGRKPLGRLVAAFKTVTTKQLNLVQGTPGQLLWQRNFYEHVIRNDDEMDRVREYIIGNPLQWEIDTENPDAAAKSA